MQTLSLVKLLLQMEPLRKVVEKLEVPGGSEVLLRTNDERFCCEAGRVHLGGCSNCFFTQT